MKLWKMNEALETYKAVIVLAVITVRNYYIDQLLRNSWET